MTTMRKNLVKMILVVVLASLLCLTLYTHDNKYVNEPPQAIAGTLFVEESDWENYPIRYLWNGWNFYPDALLTPKTYGERAQESVIPVQIGKYNNLAFGDKNHATHGSGTYVMTLILPETPHTYAIELPEIFSAYRFYVNDELRLEMGSIGQYEPLVQNRAINFEGSGTVRLMLAVRDESYIYSGMVYPPAFGEVLKVNTLRGSRISLSTAMVTATLLFAILSLWLSIKTYRKNSNAWIFFMLCLCTAVFLSSSMVHGIKPMGVQPWYTVELLSGYLITLLVFVLHNRICDVSNWARRISQTTVGVVCIIALLYSGCASQITQSIAMAFSVLGVVFKLLATAYLLVTAVIAMWRQEEQAGLLLCADIFYGTVFLWDCLLPAYEPILTGWFQQWGALAQVAALGIILWLNVARGYGRSLTFAEEQRQMQRQLDIQQEHYWQIAERVEDSRRQRHDFRQHLRTIASLTGKPEALKEYIGQITDATAGHAMISYCHDSAVDALLYYYVSAAKKMDIPIRIKVELPKEISIPSVPFCTILGNLMENALEACERQAEGEKKIELYIRWQFQKIYLLLENSFDGVVQHHHGKFISRKHEGEGIGTASVRELSKKLGGTVEFNIEGTVFQAVLILPPSEPTN